MYITWPLIKSHIKKSSSSKKVLKNFVEIKSGEWDSRQKEKKREERKIDGSRQKNKSGGSKVESTDSLEIPDGTTGMHKLQKRRK